MEKEDAWFDLRANIGTFSLFALSKGAKLVAVEPHPENFELLRLNLLLNFSMQSAPPTTVQFAVGVKQGQVELICHPHISNQYRHTTSAVGTERWENFVTVEQTTLADLLKQNPGINSVKIDIEGEEIPMVSISTDNRSQTFKS